MKKFFILMFALLLIGLPFNIKADEDDEPMVFYEEEYEDDESLDDSYDDYYDDDDDEDYYYDDDDEDSYIMEADDTLDLDDNSLTVKCTEEKKLFTANNIIFLAVGVVTGAALTIVAVVCTKGKCNCGCECGCNEEKKEKKAKKNDK